MSGYCYTILHFLDTKTRFLDIDECEEGLHKCEENLMCINELGTYDCVDSDDNLSEPKSMDKCPLGFKYDSYSNSCSGDE